MFRFLRIFFIYLIHPTGCCTENNFQEVNIILKMHGTGETDIFASILTYALLFLLLNLQAEFMEHDEKHLPIDIRLLGALAEKVLLFSLALSMMN